MWEPKMAQIHLVLLIHDVANCLFLVRSIAASFNPPSLKEPWDPKVPVFLPIS